MRWTAAFLGIAVAVSSSAVPADPRPAGLAGQPNFRDIGGYETEDGRRVRNGLIYRSGELPRLTDKDVERLQQLGIKTVVNFLTPEEIEYRGKNRLPPGVRELVIPITGEIGDVPDAAAQLVEARKTGDFRKFPPSFNPQIHEDLVSGVADDQYRKLFEILSDESNYPLVYHCSHGIHRTGTATALLLSALNVPWDTVREDYLLSNDRRKSEVMTRIDQLEGLAEDIPMSDDERNANSEAIRAFYILQPDYIDASRDGAVTEYGSLDGYLEKGLGVGDQQRRKLRQLMTEPAEATDARPD